MTGYEVKVKLASRDLTAKERVQIKDTSDCIKLDTATQDCPVIIDLDMYAVLSVHNEKSDSKDYNVYVVVDKDGTRYVTGSESFFTSMLAIYEEMHGTVEEWAIKAYRLPSKNRAGKDFITCSLV